MKPIIAVLCPMDIEFNAVEKQLGILGETLEDGFEEKRFSLENADLILARCGVGKTFASSKTQKIIMTYGPSHLFVCGVAGAIDSDLNLFDVVVPEYVIHGDVYFGGPLCKTGVSDSGRSLYEGSQAFTDRGYRADRRHVLYKGGVLATLDAFADEAKKDFLEKECNACAVDMEGAAVAQISAMLGVPFTVIRAISDSRQQSFDSFEVNAIKASEVAAKTLVQMLKEF